MVRSAWLSVFAALPFVLVAAETTTTTTVIKYFNDRLASLPDLHGKCIAITGTTSGLGYWTAFATAKRNATCLLMLNRPSPRAEKAQKEIAAVAVAGVDVQTIDCDLESLASVRAAAATVSKLVAKYGGLDVLALNAGIMDAPDNRTQDGLPLEMQVNHEAHFVLTKLLLPSMKSAANAGREVRIAAHSSCTRSRSTLIDGGGPYADKFFLKSPPGSLGGNSPQASGERYHQSKRANILFAMALHSKFAANAAEYGRFKAVAAAPGFSATDLNVPALDKRIEKWVAMSAPDGACSLLTAMFDPEVKSGDFYEPEQLTSGPPIKVISEGKALPPRFPRWILGIKDKEESCNPELQQKMWNATETGLGEKFVIEPAGSHVIVV